MPNRYLAFRFVHPDFDSSEADLGLVVDNNQSLECVSGLPSIRQAILLLLSTRPGERVMRPNYGCNLNRLTFCPNDDTTAGLAIHYVRSALDRWEPRIDILNLDANSSTQERSRLDITLEYRERKTGINERLILNLNLMGGS